MGKKLVIQAKAKDLGDNFRVRRSLPVRRQRLVGPFIFWDHLGPVTLSPDKEMVVRSHPHIGLSTITYLFSGEILHRDSLKNELAIKPGEVNWMTAGKGIVHSERSRSENARKLEGIQLWVALPKDFEDVDPSFIHHKEEDLPLISHQGFYLRLIAGEALGQKSPLPVYSNLFYLNGRSHGPGTFSFPLRPEQEGAVYVVSGRMEVENEIYEKFSMIVFEKGSSIQFTPHGSCEFMILGGDVFPEERHIWWNFVSHDPEKIEAAKKRWVEDQFDPVINEKDKIPLPGECPIKTQTPKL